MHEKLHVRLLGSWIRCLYSTLPISHVTQPSQCRAGSRSRENGRQRTWQDSASSYVCPDVTVSCRCEPWYTVSSYLHGRHSLFLVLVWFPR